MDQMSNGKATISEKSALKQPSRVFKMPAPKAPVMTNPFNQKKELAESVETFGKQKSIDTIRKISIIVESHSAQKLSEKSSEKQSIAPKKSQSEDELKKQQQAMRSQFKTMNMTKEQN